MKHEKLDVFQQWLQTCARNGLKSLLPVCGRNLTTKTNSEHIDARAFGVMYTWGGSSLVDRDWHSWLELMHTETKRKFVPRSVASFWNKCKKDGFFPSFANCRHSMSVWMGRKTNCMWRFFFFFRGVWRWTCRASVQCFLGISWLWVNGTLPRFHLVDAVDVTWERCSTLSMLSYVVWSCLVVCFFLFVCFVLFFFVSFFVSLFIWLDWLIDWLIDRLIDGLMDCSLVCLVCLVRPVLFVWVGRWGGAGRPQKNKANYINYFSDLLFMQIDHVLISVFVVSFVLLDICDLWHHGWYQPLIFMLWETVGCSKTISFW